MTTGWVVRAAIVAVLLFSFQTAGHGQAADPSDDLGPRLRERFDVVALQQGVALVPRQANSPVRLVQIADGIVTVDGETLTGQQLRDRLGADADLVLRTSYLDAERQRALAGSASVTPTPPGPATPPSDTIERSDVIRGDLVRFGGDVRVSRNERIQGDVVSIGGSVQVDGEITGDLVAIGGPVTLGPQAVVRGDLSVVGGSLTRAPGARVFGSLNEVGAGTAGGFGRGRRWSGAFGPFWSRFGSLAATVFRVTLLVLLGLIALAFGRGPIERIAARAAAAPVRSGLIGLLAEILFVPVVVLVIVVLAVSIVGIPLIALVPFAILLVMLVMLAGFIALAYQIGRGLAARFEWAQRRDYLATALGVVAIGGVTLVAKLTALASGSFGVPLSAFGYLVEYVAWTVGFGAAILALHETQTRLGHGRTGAGTAPPADPAVAQT